jgi:ABC-2 type transport system permease protein
MIHYKAYFAILKARFTTLFQYRAAAFAGILTQLFWGMLKVMILWAFYSQSTTHQPITFMEAATFIWLAQALLQLAPWTIDRELEAQIRTGNVVYELVRPVDLYWLWYSRSLAMRVVPTFLRSIPLLVIAYLFFDLPLPKSFLSSLYFLTSLFFAALLSASITALVLISLFWTISGEGILRLMPGLTLLLSGVVVPLPLFPSWLQPFISLQPFRGILDIPIRIYLGIISSDVTPYYFLFQITWTVFFIFLGKYMLQKALSRITIQGG